MKVKNPEMTHSQPLNTILKNKWTQNFSSCRSYHVAAFVLLVFSQSVVMNWRPLKNENTCSKRFLNQIKYLTTIFKLDVWTSIELCSWIGLIKVHTSLVKGYCAVVVMWFYTTHLHNLRFTQCRSYTTVYFSEISKINVFTCFSCGST